MSVCNCLITPIDLIHIRRRIGPDKATADNLIPHTIVHNNRSLLWLSISMINITSRKYPDQFYFQSRMLFFKKNKDESIPTLEDIRPITVTSLH